MKRIDPIDGGLIAALLGMVVLGVVATWSIPLLVASVVAAVAILGVVRVLNNRDDNPPGNPPADDP